MLEIYRRFEKTAVEWPHFKTVTARYRPTADIAPSRKRALKRMKAAAWMATKEAIGVKPDFFPIEGPNDISVAVTIQHIPTYRSRNAEISRWHQKWNSRRSYGSHSPLACCARFRCRCSACRRVRARRAEASEPAHQLDIGGSFRSPCWRIDLQRDGNRNLGPPGHLHHRPDDNVDLLN